MNLKASSEKKKKRKKTKEDFFTPREKTPTPSFFKKHRTPLIYLFSLFFILTFLKLASAKFFQDIVELFLTFLPMAIILFVAFSSYFQAKKTDNPQKKHQIKFKNLKNGLFLLFITLIFYLLYSPQSFTPTFRSLRKSFHIFSKENFFLLLTYLSLLLLIVSVAFFFRKRKTLSFSKAFRKTIIPYFFFLVFLVFLSAFTYPGAYSPLTSTLGDIIYTLSNENIKVLKPQTAAYQKLGSLSQTARKLKGSLTQTQRNLTQNIQTTNQDFQENLKNTKTDLSQSILQSNKDLQRKLSQDIEDKLDIHGAIMKGDLTLEDNLKAQDTIYSEDILPDKDDLYDLGSPSKHYQNLYIQNIHGSSPVTVGFHDSSHSLQNTDDLIISGSLEVDGALHADSNLNLHGHTIENLKDPQNSQEAATKLYVDNQLGQATFFNKQDNTILTATGGDNLDLQTGSLLASGLQVSSSLTLPSNSITNQYLQNSQVSLSLGEGLSSPSATLSLGDTLTLSSSLGSSVSADEVVPNSLDFAQLKDSLLLDADTEVDLDSHDFSFTGGNVGIGTDSPDSSYLLDVNGDINAQNYYLNGSLLQAQDINALPQTNPTLTSNLQTNSQYLTGDGDNEGIYIDSQGDVGINIDTPKTDLDIQGALKIGFRDSACDADREGAQRYSPDQKAMNYCDGDTWRQYNTPGCPASVTDEDGNTYETVKIGGQCWMAENLNVGVQVDSVNTGATHSDVADNGTIEKYCYNNDTNNCDTYGGLYDWREAMQYTTTAGTQGICPTGWHIPTDEEFKTLEKQLGMSTSEADNTGWRGTDEGDKMKIISECEDGANCNASLFSASMAGYRRHEGPFNSLGSHTYFWSSSESSSSNAWGRYLYQDYSDVDRFTSLKEFGFSVRCLKD